jgi:hypothetical protein
MVRPDINSTMIKRVSSIVPSSHPGISGTRAATPYRTIEYVLENMAEETRQAVEDDCEWVLILAFVPGITFLSLPETCRRERGSTKIERSVE